MQNYRLMKDYKNYKVMPNQLITKQFPYYEYVSTEVILGHKAIIGYSAHVSEFSYPFI
jgi:hypothetical protein